VRIALRLIGAIWLSALLIMGGFALVQVRAERQRVLGDVERRASLLAESLKESVEPSARRGADAAVLRLLKKFARSDRRLAVYDAFGSPMLSAPAEPAPTSVPKITDVIAKNTVGKGLRALDGRKT
jgi:hypothetical protein